MMTALTVAARGRNVPPVHNDESRMNAAPDHDNDNDKENNYQNKRT
jgi:hypothetical protein